MNKFADSIDSHGNLYAIINNCTHINDLSELINTNCKLFNLHVCFQIKPVPISDDAIINFFESFYNNKILHTLCFEDISGFFMNDISLKQLEKMLTVNTGIKNLTVKGSTIGTNGTTRIAKGLKWNNSLKYLNLSSCNISSEGGAHIAKMLKKNSNLRELYLNNNKLGVGFVDIVKSLRSNRTLQVLGVGFDVVCPMAVDELIDILETDCNLRALYFHYASLSSYNISQFANMLKVNNTLQELYLTGHDVDNRGALEITNALTTNKSLRVLDISSDKIYYENILLIVTLISSNSSLTKLHIRNNNIDDNIFTILANVLESNYSLTDIGIGYPCDRFNYIAERNKKIADEARFLKTKSIEHSIKADLS